MSKIHAKLNEIQTCLKVPKSQKNTFGGYSYRSCEDILQALTPHLKNTNTTLTIKDFIEMIGNRYYVRAEATLICCESREEYTSQAYAREPEKVRGQGESQITGATSSYARKYALNGLFAIDDTKDADATNEHGKKKEPVITEEQSTKNLDVVKERFNICQSVDELDSVKNSIGSLYNQMLPDAQQAVQDEYKTVKSAMETERG